ncbi:MAG: xanthine dehydrogenase family protein subunit M [Acidimicrobiia bacterium]
MKPPAFEYLSPTSIDEAAAALAEAGEDAKVMAGGQSLIPLLSLRLARPAVVIDLSGVRELAGISPNGSGVKVGAMTRHRTVEKSSDIATLVPLLAQAMPLIGHAAIRSRGTIGGSLAHADPAAELPSVAAALDAKFTMTSKARGERTVSAADFFQGFFTTAIQPDEILTAITFPKAAANTGYCIEEVARRHGDFAMVGAAVVLGIDGGKINKAAISLLNVHETPFRATAAEAALIGQAPSVALFADAATAGTKDLEPSGDLHASPAYRRKVGAVCIRRALEKASAQAGA